MTICQRLLLKFLAIAIIVMGSHSLKADSKVLVRRMPATKLMAGFCRDYLKNILLSPQEEHGPVILAVDRERPEGKNLRGILSYNLVSENDELRVRVQRFYVPQLESRDHDIEKVFLQLFQELDFNYRKIEVLVPEDDNDSLKILFRLGFQMKGPLVSTESVDNVRLVYETPSTFSFAVNSGFSIEEWRHYQAELEALFLDPDFVADSEIKRGLRKRIDRLHFRNNQKDEFLENEMDADSRALVLRSDSAIEALLIYQISGANIKIKTFGTRQEVGAEDHFEILIKHLKDQLEPWGSSDFKKPEQLIMQLREGSSWEVILSTLQFSKSGAMRGLEGESLKMFSYSR